VCSTYPPPVLRRTLRPQPHTHAHQWHAPLYWFHWPRACFPDPLLPAACCSCISELQNHDVNPFYVRSVVDSPLILFMHCGVLFLVVVVVVVLMEVVVAVVAVAVAAMAMGGASPSVSWYAAGRVPCTTLSECAPHATRQVCGSNTRVARFQRDDEHAVVRTCSGRDAMQFQLCLQAVCRQSASEHSRRASSLVLSVSPCVSLPRSPALHSHSRSRSVARCVSRVRSLAFALSMYVCFSLSFLSVSPLPDESPSLPHGCVFLFSLVVRIPPASPLTPTKRQRSRHQHGQEPCAFLVGGDTR
jgi:hypothetical protein